jgi:hypothetical protein
MFYYPGFKHLLILFYYQISWFQVLTFDIGVSISEL